MYTLRSRILPSRKLVINTLRTLHKQENSSITKTRTKHQTSTTRLHQYFVRRYVSSAGAEPFINGTSSSYVEDMYESWKLDPNSVHKVSSWSLWMEANVSGDVWFFHVVVFLFCHCWLTWFFQIYFVDMRALQVHFRLFYQES